MDTYTIQVHEKSIVGGLATHLVIATYKNGQLQGEYNGMSSEGGAPQAVGLPWNLSDSIKVFKEDRVIFSTGSDIVNSISVFQSTDVSAFNKKVQAMDTAVGMINIQDLDYQLLSQNSNSAAETLLRSAGLSFDNSELSGGLAPGRTNILLDSSSVGELQALSNGGSLSTGLTLAYNKLQEINSFLEGWRDRGINITLEDVLSTQGRNGGANLYGKLNMRDSEALGEMYPLEQLLQQLVEINQQHDLGETFSNMAQNAAQALAGILYAGDFMSPVAIDLDGDGIETISSLTEGKLFDFGDPDIKAHGWLSGDDGFLSLDKNANGIIDSHEELFGGRDLDGYQKLATYDENKDGKISVEDSIFASLSIWKDENENGQTDDGELKSLSHYDIGEINLANSLSTETDQGNWLALKSSTTSTGGDTSFETADVFFRMLRENSDDDQRQVSSPNSRVVLGTNRDDIINGTDIDQLFSGGAGNDQFVFTKNNGNDIIVDFEVGAGSEDSILIEGLNITTFDAVLQLAEQVGDDTFINIATDNSITLKDVQKTALHADDFQFV